MNFKPDEERGASACLPSLPSSSPPPPQQLPSPWLSCHMSSRNYKFSDAIFIFTSSPLQIYMIEVQSLNLVTILFAQSQSRYPTEETRRGRRTKRRGVVNCKEVNSKEVNNKEVSKKRGKQQRGKQQKR